MLMEDQGPSPDGLGQEYWMAPQVPYAVRQRIETVFEVLSHLPLEQPVAVVSDAGKTIALNAPLLKIVGGASTDLLGRQWSSVMPGWPDRARGFRREGEQVFEEHLGRPDGEQVWVRVSLGPIAERLETLAPGDQAGLMALARAVADAAGAECVLYNVMRGEAVETAVGWRLPPSGSS